ncbi:MAG: glycoside hydrolase domain-containing protein [Armatimonadota bacterium]
MLKMLANRCSFVFLVCVCMGTNSAIGLEEGNLTRDPVAVCVRFKSPPVIDGRLDDACWRGEPAIKELTTSRGLEKAKRATNVFLGYDKTGMYVAFRCIEPEMSKLKTGAKYVWRNDSVEVLIDSDRDREGYLHLIGDVEGNRFQQLAGIAAETPDRSVNVGWKFAVARGTDAWTAEIFIPASVLWVEMIDGTVIRANFARNEKPIPEASSWTIRTGEVCQALYFGNVIFGSGVSELTATLEDFNPMRYDRATARLVMKSASNVRLRTYINLFPIRNTKPVGFTSVSVNKMRATSLNVSIHIPDEHRFGLELWARLEKRKRSVFLGSYLYTRPPSLPRVYGFVLANLTWGKVWEASATCKVTPQAPVPHEFSREIDIFSARNEFEPFQIVVTPNKNLTNLRVRVSDLVGPEKIVSDKVSVRLVETVPVTVPTSPDCVPGNYPDPLVPFDSVDARANENTVLWFILHVGSDVKPGTYRGCVRIFADEIDPVEIPIFVRVWDFCLPEISRLRTAYGCYYEAICSWHGASTLEEKRKIATLTNENFIRHRVCPINPLAYWSLDTEEINGQMVVIWDEYDQGASMFLPRMNSFNLPGAFMSSVRKYRSNEPGYAEEKKQFLRIVASYLREKGWFEKGYNYIFDEPDPDRYPDIVREAAIWHEADPQFKILLTEQPEPELYGAVDIWVPVLDAYIRAICQLRQAKGDEVWWYVCCGPHHPYPNNFIDYPAVDHRIIHWMSWKYGVTGVLYWQTVFWRKDPWQHPMNDEGGKNLGNGDGTLLYPATRKPSQKLLLEGPLDSIRWEMIREGIEDYDYFAMLRDAIQVAVIRGVDRKLIDAGKKALGGVDEVVRSVVDYEKDPRKLASVRIRVGNALEELVVANNRRK